LNFARSQMRAFANTRRLGLPDTLAVKSLARARGRPQTAALLLRPRTSQYQWQEASH
jgi:hypothetical protein